ncbi:MAG: Snf7 family protein [Candidatus Bathyarchaeia archaeon]
MLEAMLREWDGEEKSTHRLSRLRIFRSETRSRSLRERITLCIYTLRVQKEKLEIIIFRLKRRDREFFDKCVNAQIVKDEARAKIYAEECLQTRKIFRIVLHCKIALEQVILRLETIEIFIDLAGAISIPIHLIYEVKERISSILPSVSSQLGKVADELEDIVVVAGKIRHTPLEVSETTEEAKGILEEARAVVEEKVKRILPDIPTEDVEMEST